MADDPRDVRSLPTASRLAGAAWEKLWIDGDPSALAPPLVAIIGTREPDPVGAALARRIAHDLARAGLRVLSGGAIGIDAAAHRGALHGGGRTVVVLPSGLGHWYPRRHERLYRDILAAGGALVSQFPPETPPTRWTFPRRNKLVATLADVVVVVQAPATSGALLAAECARRLGRRVMAVPAAPADRRGAGCLRLLRAGALPCADADDVLSLLASGDGPLMSAARRPPVDEGRPDAHPVGPSAGRLPSRSTRSRTPRARALEQPELPGFQGDGDDLTASLDGDGRLVYDSLSSVARHVDELSRLTGLPAARLQRSLLTLVLAGLVTDRGDGKYTRG